MQEKLRPSNDNASSTETLKPTVHESALGELTKENIDSLTERVRAERISLENKRITKGSVVETVSPIRDRLTMHFTREEAEQINAGLRLLAKEKDKQQVEKVYATMEEEMAVITKDIGDKWATQNKQSQEQAHEDHLTREYGAPQNATPKLTPANENIPKESASTPTVESTTTAPVSTQTEVSPEIRIHSKEEGAAFIERLRDISGKQQKAVEERAEKKGLLEKIREVGDAYNKLPLWKKLALGGGLMALGIPLGGIPQKILNGVGMYTTIDAFLMKPLENHPRLRGTIAGAGAAAYGILASQLFTAIDSKLGISETLSKWFSSPAFAATNPNIPIEKIPAMDNSAFTLTDTNISPEQSIGAEGKADAMETFSTSTGIGRGDTVWGIAQQQLGHQPQFNGLDGAQKSFMVDSYLKHMQSLGKEAVQAMGIASGDINTIRMGERVNLSALNDHRLFDQFMERAQNLTEAQKSNILRTRG